MKLSDYINPVNQVSGAVNSVTGGVNAIKTLFTSRKKLAAEADERQRKQQTALNQINSRTAKEMADYEQALKLKMWQDTNYTAQLREAQKAGVSKAAVLGGSGAGGAGAATGAEVGGGGIGAGASGGAANQMANQQAELIEAQKQNIMANTEKTKSETTNINADTSVKNYQAEFDKIRNEIQGESKWDQINTIKSAAEKMLGEANSAAAKGAIDTRTQVEQGNKIISEAEIAALMIGATKAGTKLTQEEAKAVQVKLDQRWEGLKVEREGQQVSRENMEKLTETMLWSAGIQATGNIINSLIDIRKMKWSKKFDRETTKRNAKKFQTEHTTTRDKHGQVTGSKEVDKYYK